MFAGLEGEALLCRPEARTGDPTVPPTCLRFEIMGIEATLYLSFALSTEDPCPRKLGAPEDAGIAEHLPHGHQGLSSRVSG